MLHFLLGKLLDMPVLVLALANSFLISRSLCPGQPILSAPRDSNPSHLSSHFRRKLLLHVQSVPHPFLTSLTSCQGEPVLLSVLALS